MTSFKNNFCSRLSLFLTLVLTNGCSYGRITGPLSPEQAHAIVPLNIRSVGNNDLHEGLNVIYYYYDLEDELRLDAYFVTGNSPNGVMRIARLSEYTLASQLVSPEEIVQSAAPLHLLWAKDEVAYSCKVLPVGIGNDLFNGDSYASCLYWFGQDGNRYKLYSVWSGDKAAGFANSLIEIKN
jgi:hypothetical protein